MLEDSQQSHEVFDEDQFAHHIYHPPKTNMTKSKIHHFQQMYFLLKKWGKNSQPVIWVFSGAPQSNPEPGNHQVPSLRSWHFSGGLKRLVGFETPSSHPKKNPKGCVDFRAKQLLRLQVVCFSAPSSSPRLQRDWLDLWRCRRGKLGGKLLALSRATILSFFWGTIHMIRLDMGSKWCSIYVGELFFVIFTAELSILTSIYYDHSFFCRRCFHASFGYVCTTFFEGAAGEGRWNT